MSTIIRHRGPSMENGQQCQKEGWQVLSKLGRPVSYTRRCRRRSLSLRTLIWGRDSQHLECIPPQILLQLNVYSNRTNTCNPDCTLFPRLVFFSLRRVLARDVLTRHPYSINKKKGSQLYVFSHVFSFTFV